MAEERVEPKPIDLGEYKFGFHDDVEPVLSTGKGLNEGVIRELSAAKGEPEWMLEFRLKSYETFKKMPMQTWGADLSEIDKKHLTNQPVLVMKFLRKSKKPLNVSEFQKLSVLIQQGPLPSTSQKWYTTT